MTRALVIRSEAEADITAAAIWYHQRRAGLGEEFLAEVEAALGRAVAAPLHH